MTEIQFIDVSKYQSQTQPVNWNTYVNAGYEVAIIRAFNGYVEDPFFASNRKNAHAAGIKYLGIYSPPAPDDDAANSARKTFAITGDFAANEFPCLDIESFSGVEQPNYSQRIKDWRAVATKAVPHAKQWVYSDSSHWQDNIDPVAVVGAVRWVARYGATPQVPWDVFQFTSSGSVPGVTGAVDISKYEGTTEQLAALTFRNVVPQGDPLMEAIMAFYADKQEFEDAMNSIFGQAAHRVLGSDTVVGAAAFGPKFRQAVKDSAGAALTDAGFKPVAKKAEEA